MRGFFEKTATQLPYRSEKGIHSCASCGLYKSAHSPKMEPYGACEKGIMVIGEGPGEDEDRKGRPWQGRTGHVLQQQYTRLGIDLFRDCVSLNAVNCRPVDKKGFNRPPTEYEIACCRQKVIDAIAQYKPGMIMLHGAGALSSLIGYKWKKDLGGVMKWRGWTIPDREYGAWLCPTFHPSYVERQEEDNEVAIIWERDIQRAFEKVGKPFPFSADEEQRIIVSENPGDVLPMLLKEAPPLMTIDIETTGLKPYNKAEHQIVAISFCFDVNRAYAIPFPTEKRHLGLLKRILTNPNVGKIAANMKHEDNWLNVLHGIEVNPWAFDTMQAAHVLDNRPGITGLKFQAYIQFGVLGYDEEVSPYLHSSAPNIPNRILELTRDKDSFRRLLLYCGMDSLLEFRLAELQMKEMGW